MCIADLGPVKVVGNAVKPPDVVVGSKSAKSACSCHSDDVLSRSEIIHSLLSPEMSTDCDTNGLSHVMS